LFDRLSPVEHGVGLMLVVEVPAFTLPVATAHDLVYLDGIQDPGNVGTLLRTAAAAGVQSVLSGPTAAALWAPKTLRAAQGAHFRLRLHEQVAAEALPAMLDGPWLGADAMAGTPLWSTALPERAVGWIFGAEGAGLSPAARAVCRQCIRIPLDAAAESLNVAAAAAICLFERRRRLCPSP
jgi:TrmH family RNA methyltransferase